MKRLSERVITTIITATMLISVFSIGIVSKAQNDYTTIYLNSYGIGNVTAVLLNSVLTTDYQVENQMLSVNLDTVKPCLLQISDDNGEYIFAVINGIAEYLPTLENAFTYDGAAISVEDNDSLRFIFSVSDSVKNAGNIDLVKYGAVLIKSDVLGNADLIIGTAGVEGISSYKADGTAKISFSTALKGISLDDYTIKYTVRPYLTFIFNDKTFTVYGNAISSNIYEVAKKIIADDNRGFELASDKGKYVLNIVRTIDFTKNEYILDESVSDTAKFANGFNFWIKTESVGTRDMSTLQNSIQSCDVGDIATAHSITGTEEWGYSFLHNNGIIDGAGRVIEAGYTTPPVSRTDALAQIKSWIFSQYNLPQMGNWHSVNGYYNWQHYAGEFGAAEVASEIGENVNSYQMHIAFTRGAAKQYSIPWYMDFSSWYGGYVRDYGETKTWVAGGVTYGHSLNIMERSFVMSYMSGARAIDVEGGGALSFYDSTDSSGNYILTPFGEVCKKFNSFINTNTDAGTTYTPFGLVLDYYHGIQAGWTSFPGFTDKAFGYFDYNDGDYMTQGLTSLFYGNSWKISPTNSTGVAEDHAMVNSKYSDSADVLLQNASQKVLNSYPCLILSGDISFSNEEIARYEEYVEQGGTLILNTAYLDSFADYEALYDGKTRCDIEIDNGKVIIYGSDYSVSNLQSIIDEQFEAHMPVAVSQNVQRIINVKDDVMYVTLINNDGVTKEYTEEEVYNENYATAVTVEYKGNQKVKSVSDIYNANEVTQTNNSVSLTLSAGGIAVLEFKFK